MEKTLLQMIIQNCDASDKTEAKEIIEEMIQELKEGKDPEDVLIDHGIDADYAMDLLDYYLTVN